MKKLFFGLASLIISLNVWAQCPLSVTGTITGVSSPFDVAVSPNDSTLYVVNSGNNTVSVISTATGTVTATIPVGSNPNSIVISPDGTMAYVANFSGNTVSVISTATNTVTATVSGVNYPYDIVITPDGSKLYTESAGGSVVSVISTATNTVTKSIPMICWAEGIAISPDGSTVYVANTCAGMVSVISTALDTITTTFNTGGQYPVGIAVSPDGSKLYIANQYSDIVSIVSSATYTILKTDSVGHQPFGVAISADGSTVYVSNYGGNTVSVMSTATDSVTATISVGDMPYRAAVSSDGYSVYVANNNGNSVSVLSYPVSRSTITDTACSSYTFFDSTYTASGTYTHIIAGGNSVGCDSIITLNLTIKNAAHSTLGTWKKSFLTFMQEAWGVTIDTSGNIYVARPDYGDIKKITPSGDTSTFASGLNSPTDITSDGNGILYVAQMANPAIFDMNGNYLGDLASTNGYGSICRDNSGNTYISGGWSINKITSGGTVSSFLSGTPDYIYPGGSMAADNNGNIYASQYNNGNVLKITPLGEVDTFATGLSHPKGVTIDADGNVYIVSESYNLYKITPAGIVSVLMSDALYGEGITTARNGIFYATDGNGVFKIFQAVEACGGYTFGGNTLTQSGTYYDTIPAGAANGCDSIVTVNLVIYPQASDTANITECDSFIWRTHTYTASGFYRDTVAGAAAHGCDSIYNLNLTIFDASSASIADSICVDSTYHFNGVMLTAAGIYYDTLLNANGCDSVITLTLSIKTSDCVPTGIDNVAKNRISLSPNPSSGLFTVVSDIAENGLIEVYAVTGTKVYSKNALSLSKNEINLSDQAKGVYVVKVSNAETVWTQRVLVE